MTKKLKTPERIFISHTALDKPIVDAYVKAFKSTLNRKQATAFFYSSDGGESVKHGDDLVGTVVENLRKDKTACVITFLSKNSYQKPWLNFEAGAAYLQSRLLTVLLPGCPEPKDIGQEHPFFTRGAYYDLRMSTEPKLGNFYGAVAKYFDIDDDEIADQKKKFAQIFIGHAKDFLVDQVTSVCVRKLNSDKEPMILLVKNIDTNGTGNAGKRRHFPKDTVKLADAMLPLDVVARLCINNEAGITALPLLTLGSFVHFKHESKEVLRVAAYAMQYQESVSTTSKRKNVIERAPEWFSLESALREVAIERPEKYANELQKIIRKAFINWEDRNGE